MLGVVTVNTTALYLEMDLDKVQNGQYARNAVLIGPSLVDCLGFDFPLNPTRSGWPILLFLTMVLSLVTFLLEALWLQHSLRRFRWRNGCTPSLLVPYNITLLLTLCCAKIWNSTMLTQVVFQNHAYYHEDTDEERENQNHGIVQVPPDDGEFLTISTTNIHNYHTNTSFYVFPAVVKSLSRIFFVDGMVTGLLILLGVTLCSRIVAGSLIGGALLSSAFVGYAIFDENLQYLNTGYAGFQAALCVAGIFHYFVPSTKLLGLSFLAILPSWPFSGPSWCRVPSMSSYVSLVFPYPRPLGFVLFYYHYCRWISILFLVKVILYDGSPKQNCRHRRGTWRVCDPPYLCLPKRIV